jgi:hypothetical protein
VSAQVKIDGDAQALAAHLEQLCEDPVAMECGRKAVEDVAIKYRDGRLSEPFRGNGVVIREKDGRESPVIRFGPEAAVRFALLAIAKALRGEGSE